MNDTVESSETPKATRSADEYLRFALKSESLIENIAKRLDWYSSMLKQSVGGNTTRDTIRNYISRQSNLDSSQADDAAVKLKRQMDDIDDTAENLRSFNNQVFEVYTNSPASVEIVRVSDPAQVLKNAKKLLEGIQGNRDLRTSDPVKNGGITADIEAIDLRLLPVLGKDGEFKKSVDAYHIDSPKRLAEAQRSKMPEGLDKVSETRIDPYHVPDKVTRETMTPLSADNEEHRKIIPRVERKSRATQFDADGKRLVAVPLYRKIKDNEALRLMDQSAEAEKTRNGEGPAWERRIEEEKSKSGIPDVQER